jgi:hypothetical protein
MEDSREAVAKERASPLFEERLDPLLVGFEAFAEGMEMLASMIEVNNLDSPLKPVGG